MHGTAWSLLPFVIVIPLAVITRQVLPGLLVGLLVGSYMIHPGVLTGLQTTIEYMIKELTIKGNLRLLLFLYGFGAFVGLVRITGGVSGFAEWMGKRVKGIKGAFLVTWISSLATFMAPDFRIITVAPVMKQVFSKLHVPTKKVAFVIDATATPLTAVIPIGTAFVGYMVGLIGTAGRHQGIAVSPYTLFLYSIPLNFFSTAMLGYALFVTFFQKAKATESSAQAAEGSNTQAETGTTRDGSKDNTNEHEATEGTVSKRLPRVAPNMAYMETAQELTPVVSTNAHLDRHESPQSHKAGKVKSKDKGFPDAVELVADNVQPDVSNLILPLVSLLVFTLFLTWWDGHLHSNTFFGALTHANAGKAMVEALLATLIIAFSWYAYKRQPIARTMFGLLQGGNEMMAVNVLLILIWAVSAVSTDLGFVSYTEGVINRIVPSSLIAPALFVFGCAISYVIGSSFGTWGMLLPLGFSLAAHTHASLALIAGAVFASGTFGGFVSPLSDNTVAMATVMKLPIMDYAKVKLKAGLLMAGLCTVFYAGAGFLMG
ncbi:Na+/H+ antiporter NhaC family protein [Alicyclobacillus sp. SO9]|uniref:Na+/H+ antiporter NhaC family protein n=1 Tax=Alicyclobacillus sp. SO9 TaxID=2665646 RepID=UPI0018E6E0AC|nr:Na+/H+ antiporter NhaC family protein [Alicyclobacillus sp. SO9]QQE77779.1 sodium:proton antiporter [Alicyclobacillus sp. SO9]